MCSLRRTAPALAMSVCNCYTSALVLLLFLVPALVTVCFSWLQHMRAYSMLLWQPPERHTRTLLQETEAEAVTVACMCMLAVSSICHRGCFTRDV